MSDCACIYGGGGEDPSVCLTRWRTARKAGACNECRGAIAPGDRYEQTTGRWDGKWESFKTCSPCVEIRGALFCEGWVYGQVWESIGEHISHGGKVMGCIKELETVAAKVKLATFARQRIGM